MFACNPQKPGNVRDDDIGTMQTVRLSSMRRDLHFVPATLRERTPCMLQPVPWQDGLFTTRLVSSNS